MGQNTADVLVGETCGQALKELKGRRKGQAIEVARARAATAVQGQAATVGQPYRGIEQTAQQAQGRTADMGTQQHDDGRMAGLRQAGESGERAQQVAPAGPEAETGAAWAASH